MSNFDSIIESLQNEDYPTKKQLLEYTLHVIERIREAKKELDREDAAALLAYAPSKRTSNRLCNCGGENQFHNVGRGLAPAVMNALNRKRRRE